MNTNTKEKKGEIMKNKRFEDCFLQYKNLVIRLVMSKTGDYQAAQEICQQVFISFYNNMDRISDDLVKAWLMRCTQNAIVDYLRKNKGKPEIHLDESSIAQSGNVLVEESVEIYEERRNNRELVGRILREVKAVNEQWFDILVMNCVDGLSYSEIAKRLNIPEPVLRARMYRARVFIKQKFGDEYMDK